MKTVPWRQPSHSRWQHYRPSIGKQQFFKRWRLSPIANATSSHQCNSLLLNLATVDNCSLMPVFSFASSFPSYFPFTPFPLLCLLSLRRRPGLHSSSISTHVPLQISPFSLKFSIHFTLPSIIFHKFTLFGPHVPNLSTLKS